MLTTVILNQDQLMNKNTNWLKVNPDLGGGDQICPLQSSLQKNCGAIPTWNFLTFPNFLLRLPLWEKTLANITYCLSPFSENKMWYEYLFVKSIQYKEIYSQYYHKTIWILLKTAPWIHLGPEHHSKCLLSALKISL